MAEPDPSKPTPAHRSKLGLSKLIVQGIAFGVGVANYIWDLGFEFTEAHAAIVIGIVESLWQGKQQVERKRIARQAVGKDFG